MHFDPAHSTLTVADVPPVEFVPVAPTGRRPLPAATAARVLIHVIHDGRFVPPRFLVDDRGAPIPVEEITAEYVRERDWGAAAVAARVAAHLGLEGYLRVQTARVLVDYGRFPGATRRGSSHLDRHALSSAFSDRLGWEQRRAVLTDVYDACSAAYEQHLSGRVLMLGFHTYDSHNPSGTGRPEVSLILRPLSMQRDGRLAADVFDPLFPHELAEFTADRTLRDRMSLTLTRAGLRAVDNYPYLLPEGSLEVRAQVWAFFHHARQRFEEAHPHTVDAPAFRAVWDLLLDTNLRSTESEALRSYLHMLREAPPRRKDLFRAAQDAWTEVGGFLQEAQVAARWLRSPHHLSSMAIEVRKDLLCDFEAGHATGLHEDAVERVAAPMADAIATWFAEDRQPLP